MAAGLESIALAVAHLEKEGANASTSRDGSPTLETAHHSWNRPAPPLSSEARSSSSSPTIPAFSQPMGYPPRQQSFADAPRWVSAESVPGVAVTHPLPTVASYHHPHQPPAHLHPYGRVIYHGHPPPPPYYAAPMAVPPPARPEGPHVTSMVLPYAGERGVAECPTSAMGPEGMDLKKGEESSVPSVRPPGVNADGELDMAELDQILASVVPKSEDSDEPAKPIEATGDSIKAPEPSEVIKELRQNDVLCGRGGETNHHAGNIRYRQLVKLCQPAYIAAKRRDKPKIAQRIVKAVRLFGGRFLKKDQTTQTWRDVGNAKAREKTSQALREGAPELRNGGQSPKEGPSKQPIKKWGKNLKPELLVVPEMASPMRGEGPSFPRMVEVSEPASKKRRISMSTGYLGEPSSSSPTQITVSSSSQAEVSPVSNSELKSPCDAKDPSPVAFSATVSADDDDSANGSQKSVGDDDSQGAKSGRGGPRIKLLKRRLESRETL